MTKVFVTGGAGFIGSHYVRAMLAGCYPGYEDARVTVVDKLTYAGNTANLPLGHPLLTFVRADICDQEVMAELLPGHDAVVHFAAESHVDKSIVGAARFFETNVLGTQNLLEICERNQIGPIVCVSTDEVYGSIERGTWTEESPLLPNSPYSASKAGSDLLARSYARTYDLDVRITRCSNNYGPCQHVEKLIPLFVTNLLDGLPVPLYGNGMNSREWLHVDDHCWAIQLVLTKGEAGEAYNIGGGVRLTNREMTARLLDLCGADWRMVRQAADRPGHDLRYAVDDTKARLHLGFEPRIPFDRGLEEVVQWYRDNPGWWRPLKPATSP